MLDATQHRMIIGDKYEMYTPIAQMSSASIGLVFDDAKGYTFTYAGTIKLLDDEYIASPDVHYLEMSIPKLTSPELQQAFLAEGKPHPLCPAYIAGKFVRPVTNG